MSEHKNCPHCGGTPEPHSYISTKNFVLCALCRNGTAMYEKMSDAWEVWDRRYDAAVKALVEEHRTWAQEFGAALLLALQGDYSKVDDLAHDIVIDFPDGAPVIRSEAIKKVEGV